LKRGLFTKDLIAKTYKLRLITRQEYMASTGSSLITLGRRNKDWERLWKPRKKSYLFYFIFILSRLCWEKNWSLSQGGETNKKQKHKPITITTKPSHEAASSRRNVCSCSCYIGTLLFSPSRSPPKDGLQQDGDE
jgi:hypothetical protein